jgi:hypothetical protein
MIMEVVRKLCFTNNKYVLWDEYAFVFFLFCLSPVSAVLFSFLRLLSAHSNDKWRYYTFFICLALWLGAINATKTVLSDPGNWQIFKDVPTQGFYSTIFEAWGGTGKEPFYSSISYIGYYLCFGQLSIFICLLSAAMYLLHFIATYKLLTKLDAGKGAILCGVLALAFFTQYFTLTIHLVRQMLAAAIVIYAVTLKAIDGKNKWILLIMAFLTHTSSGLLVILSLIPALSKKMSFSKLTVALVCFIPVIIFNTQIGNIIKISSFTAIDYGIGRFAGMTSDAERNLPMSLLFIVLLPLMIISVKKIFFEKKEQVQLYLIYNLFLFLALFIFMFYKNPFIQYRFFYYGYSFIPLLLPMLVSKRNKLSPLYYTSVSLFFIVRFFILYDSMTWKYDGMIWKYVPLIDALFLPFPYLLFNPYF